MCNISDFGSGSKDYISHTRYFPLIGNYCIWDISPILTATIRSTADSAAIRPRIVH